MNRSKEVGQKILKIIELFLSSYAILSILNGRKIRISKKFYDMVQRDKVE